MKNAILQHGGSRFSALLAQALGGLAALVAGSPSYPAMPGKRRPINASRRGYAPSRWADTNTPRAYHGQTEEQARQALQSAQDKRDRKAVTLAHNAARSAGGYHRFARLQGIGVGEG